MTRRGVGRVMIGFAGMTLRVIGRVMIGFAGMTLRGIGRVMLRGAGLVGDYGFECWVDGSFLIVCDFVIRLGFQERSVICLSILVFD